MVVIQEIHTFAAMAGVSASNTNFALDLLRTLSLANPDGNVFISPFSISSALAMVYLGAKEETAAQMAKVNQVSHSLPLWLFLL